jgi:hypothetical protein
MACGGLCRYDRGRREASMALASAYYRACQGRWRASYQLTITDLEAFERSGLGWLDRWSLRLLARWPRWLGWVYMDTSVDCHEHGRVMHTTVVRWLGLPLMRSVEIFTLADDGASFTVSGGMTGTGRVDATTTRADYELRWRGAPIVQYTERTAERVTVHQQGPGFRGLQVLVRQVR